MRSSAPTMRHPFMLLVFISCCITLLKAKGVKYSPSRAKRITSQKSHARRSQPRTRGRVKQRKEQEEEEEKELLTWRKGNKNKEKGTTTKKDFILNNLKSNNTLTNLLGNITPQEYPEEKSLYDAETLVLICRHEQVDLDENGDGMISQKEYSSFITNFVCLANPTENCFFEPGKKQKNDDRFEFLSKDIQALFVRSVCPRDDTGLEICLDNLNAMKGDFYYQEEVEEICYYLVPALMSAGMLYDIDKTNQSLKNVTANLANLTNVSSTSEQITPISSTSVSGKDNQPSSETETETEYPTMSSTTYDPTPSTSWEYDYWAPLTLGPDETVEPSIRTSDEMASSTQSPTTVQAPTSVSVAYETNGFRGYISKTYKSLGTATFICILTGIAALLGIIILICCHRHDDKKETEYHLDPLLQNDESIITDEGRYGFPDALYNTNDKKHRGVTSYEDKSTKSSQTRSTEALSTVKNAPGFGNALDPPSICSDDSEKSEKQHTPTENPLQFGVGVLSTTNTHTHTDPVKNKDAVNDMINDMKEALNCANWKKVYDLAAKVAEITCDDSDDSTKTSVVSRKERPHLCPDDQSRAGKVDESIRKSDWIAVAAKAAVFNSIKPTNTTVPNTISFDNNRMEKSNNTSTNTTTENDNLSAMAMAAFPALPGATTGSGTNRNDKNQMPEAGGDAVITINHIPSTPERKSESKKIINSQCETPPRKTDASFTQDEETWYIPKSSPSASLPPIITPPRSKIDEDESSQRETVSPDSRSLYTASSLGDHEASLGTVSF